MVKISGEPSFAEAFAIDSVADVSMFRIVPVALDLPISAPSDGADNVTVIVRSDVATLS